MAKRRLGALILLLCFCVCILPCHVQATSTTDATDPIDTQKDCTLTIRYAYNDTPFPGQTVTLYRVADVSADYQYTLTQTFAPSDLILNGIQTNSEWDVIRSTLDVYTLIHSPEPAMTAVTDELGNACFEPLKPGLYLASAVEVVQGDLSCTFDPVLVTLPGLDANGNWQYALTVAAKPGILPPIDPDEKTEYKVLKLWRGDNGETGRPKSIEVTIFRDGLPQETVVLSEENHWSYSWPANDDGAQWKVVEQNVPDGYTMTVEQKETTFIITNTRPNEPTPPPSQTGDTANILLYTVLMYASGGLLILLGIAGKRKRHEETN